MKILIVEDDPIIADDIASILEDAGYESVEICLHAEDVIPTIDRFSPDLLLLDITLNNNASGISLGFKIKQQFAIPIIFVTSHSDKHTISLAGEVEPVGYLVKPIQPESLVSTIEIGIRRSKEDHSKNSSSEEAFIFVKVKGRHERINLQEIIYAEAYDNYTNIYLSDKKYTVTGTLKSVGEKLSEAGMMRVHRSYIINPKKIIALEEACLITENKAVIPVSRKYRNLVAKHFNIL